MVAGSMPTVFNIIVSSKKKNTSNYRGVFLILSGVACSNWELVSGPPNKNQNRVLPWFTFGKPRRYEAAAAARPCGEAGRVTPPLGRRR